MVLACVSLGKNVGLVLQNKEMEDFNQLRSERDGSDSATLTTADRVFAIGACHSDPTKYPLVFSTRVPENQIGEYAYFVMSSKQIRVELPKNINAGDELRIEVPDPASGASARAFVEKPASIESETVHSKPCKTLARSLCNTFRHAVNADRYNVRLKSIYRRILASAEMFLQSKEQLTWAWSELAVICQHERVYMDCPWVLMAQYAIMSQVENGIFDARRDVLCIGASLKASLSPQVKWEELAHCKCVEVSKMASDILDDKEVTHERYAYLSTLLFEHLKDEVYMMKEVEETKRNDYDASNNSRQNAKLPIQILDMLHSQQSRVGCHENGASQISIVGPGGFEHTIDVTGLSAEQKFYAAEDAIRRISKDMAPNGMEISEIALASDNTKFSDGKTLCEKKRNANLPCAASSNPLVGVAQDDYDEELMKVKTSSTEDIFKHMDILDFPNKWDEGLRRCFTGPDNCLSSQETVLFVKYMVYMICEVHNMDADHGRWPKLAREYLYKTIWDAQKFTRKFDSIKCALREGMSHLMCSAFCCVDPNSELRYMQGILVNWVASVAQRLHDSLKRYFDTDACHLENVLMEYFFDSDDVPPCAFVRLSILSKNLGLAFGLWCILCDHECIPLNSDYSKKAQLCIVESLATETTNCFNEAARLSMCAKFKLDIHTNWERLKAMGDVVVSDLATWVINGHHVNSEPACTHLRNILQLPPETGWLATLEKLARITISKPAEIAQPKQARLCVQHAESIYAEFLSLQRFEPGCEPCRDWKKVALNDLIRRAVNKTLDSVDNETARLKGCFDTDSSPDATPDEIYKKKSIQAQRAADLLLQEEALDKEREQAQANQRRKRSIEKKKKKIVAKEALVSRQSALPRIEEEEIDKRLDHTESIPGAVEETDSVDAGPLYDLKDITSCLLSTPSDAATSVASEVACVVCFKNERAVALVPCGHRCVCKDCGHKEVLRNMKGEVNCPLCRTPVNSFLEIFG